MAGHGYLRDYDEGYERNEEDWRDRQREKSFMLGERPRDEAPRGRTQFTSHPDAHYLSWRERHMRELDRDYAEYRREREQQFHQDFDAWRRQRRGNTQPPQPGMTQTGTSSIEPTLELTTEAASATETGQDPVSTATLGTTSSGRGRR